MVYICKRHRFYVRFRSVETNSGASFTLIDWNIAKMDTIVFHASFTRHENECNFSFNIAVNSVLVTSFSLSHGVNVPKTPFASSDSKYQWNKSQSCVNGHDVDLIIYLSLCKRYTGFSNKLTAV